MNEIILESYYEEWMPISENGTILEQNEWIFSHFKFLGKDPGNKTFTQDDAKRSKMIMYREKLRIKLDY